MTRSLAVIPIVHTEADLGQLADHLRAQTGEEAWADKQRAVGEIWRSIAEWCDAADVEGLQIFQDGLPDDPNAARIVKELASKGSLNHKLLQGMVDRGAELLGTEDPQLLLREYEIAKAAAEAIEAGRQPDPRDAQRSATILERRDQYIADKIDASLGDGDRAVLFIGMLHDVESKLADDIAIDHPLGRPAPERRTA